MKLYITALQVGMKMMITTDQINHLYEAFLVAHLAAPRKCSAALGWAHHLA